MILRQAAGLGLQGTAAGACLVLALRPLIPGLPQAAMMGPAMIAAAVSLLIAVALIAAWPPARRAARIDPILALKREWSEAGLPPSRFALRRGRLAV